MADVEQLGNQSCYSPVPSRVPWKTAKKLDWQQNCGLWNREYLEFGIRGTKKQIHRKMRPKEKTGKNKNKQKNKQTNKSIEKCGQKKKQGKTKTNKKQNKRKRN